MLLAGGGMKGFAAPGDGSRLVEYGFVAPSLLRDIFCAADFVINDAERYLTSAVIRTAMSYSRPVLVRPFGSAIDMARGASIHIGDGQLAVRHAFAEASSASLERREALAAEAALRNAERSWRDAGNACVRLYLELGETKTRASSASPNRRLIVRQTRTNV